MSLIKELCRVKLDFLVVLSWHLSCQNNSDEFGRVMYDWIQTLELFLTIYFFNLKPPTSWLSAGINMPYKVGLKMFLIRTKSVSFKVATGCFIMNVPKTGEIFFMRANSLPRKGDLEWKWLFLVLGSFLLDGLIYDADFLHVNK